MLDVDTLKSQLDHASIDLESLLLLYQCYEELSRDATQNIAQVAEKLKPGSEASIALSALADHEANTGNLARAIEIYTQLLAKVLAYGPKQDTYLVDAVEISRIYAALAELHHKAGHMELKSDFEARRELAQPPTPALQGVA